MYDVAVPSTDDEEGILIFMMVVHCVNVCVLPVLVIYPRFFVFRVLAAVHVP